MFFGQMNEQTGNEAVTDDMTFMQQGKKSVVDFY